MVLVVCLSTIAFAEEFPMMLINPLDGTGVTPSGLWTGGTSLSLTGLAAPDAGGTTQCLVIGVNAFASQNYSLSGRVSSTTESELGFGARSTGMQGYLLTVNFASGGHGGLNLIKVIGGAGSNLASQMIPDSSPTGEYDIVFSVDGSSLIGQAYNTDGDLLLTLTATDSSYTTGNLALLLTETDTAYTSPINGSWSNLNVGDPIPEPATMTLVAIGAVAMLSRRKRK